MLPAIQFTDRSDLLQPHPANRSYGCCIVDSDGDGAPEIFVGVVAGPNHLYKWNGRKFEDIAPPILADAGASAIGVAAADFSGNGLPDFYILNTSAFMGGDTDPDRLLINHGKHNFEDAMANHPQRNTGAGRSVAWLDVLGDGLYSPFVCNYGAPNRLYLNQPRGLLRDRAPQMNLDRTTGGRGVVCQDFFASGRMDIFCVNENDQNALYRNLGNGEFDECAIKLGLADRAHHGRGLQTCDILDNGRTGFIYANWEAVNRLFAWDENRMRFTNRANISFATASRARTLIVADFDNDSHEEVFINNLGQPNRMFRLLPGGQMEPLDAGVAELPHGLGTGATVGDLNGDGFLDLFISHGETAPQPNALLFGEPNGNHWLRVHAQTHAGAPAIGAVVQCNTGPRTQTRWIDGGSGYLCQMEPVAHFGLGTHNAPVTISVRFSTGKTSVVNVTDVDRNIVVRA